jgi:hypothetical protein
LIVCTVHNETGNATAAELHWLLGCLRPEVLFLERSPTDFSAFLDGSCGSLESAAVMRYRNHNAVELVPVDIHLPAAELRQEFDAMFDRIEEASQRYRELEAANRQHTAAGGLAYLNSPTGVLRQSEMQKEILATVDAVGEPWLTDLYARWTRANDLRESAMISGVEAFAKRASFGKGVLLVGAAHRQSLLEKSRLRPSDGPSPITWDFDWEPEGDCS